MNELTKRFISVYNKLLLDEKVDNATDFAKKIGVSRSLMTEILKGRTNVGVIPLQNTVKLFQIDANYLLTGIVADCPGEALEMGEPAHRYGSCMSCQDKERIISSQADTIALLREKVEAIKDRNKDNKEDLKQTG